MRKLLYFGIFVVLMSFSSNMLTAQSDTSCDMVLLAELQDNYRGNVSWSPDSKFIAAMYVELGDYARLLSLTVHVLDSQTLELVASLPQDILEASVISPLLWSPDSQSIAIVKESTNIIEIWTPSTMQSVVINPDADPEVITKVVWSLNGRELAVIGVTIDRDQYRIEFDVRDRLRIWDTLSGKMIYEYFGVRHHQIDVAYADNQWIVAERTLDDPVLRVTGLSDKKIYFEQTNAYIVDFKLIADDLMLATVSLNDDPLMNQGTVWNLTTEAQILEITGEANLRASRFAEVGSTFKAYTGTPDLTLYALESGISLSFDNHSVSASPDGKWLLALERLSGGSVAITATGDFTLMNLSSGEPIATFSGDLISVRGLAWSPDSQRIAVTGISGILKVWSLEGCLNP